MKSSKFLALSAITLLGFSACQKPELESELTSGATHTVTFVAGAPETKTTVDISDGETARFAWTEYDESRFTVYENGTAATETIGVLGEDGKMTLSATFDGITPASPSYQALYNTAVSSTQTANDLYDETADVLVSAVLNDIDRDAVSYFSFKRESAIAKMTLKDLTDGAFVSSVTINSDKAIAGKYDLANGSFSSTSNTITITSLSKITGGEATVWFASVPVEGATFTVTATAVDNNDNVVATYTKTFSNTITLTRGDVKGFRVAMNKLVDPHKDHNGWFLVKDTRFLAAGDVIRIGCASAGKVAGALSGAILSSESATYESEQMVSVSSAEDYTLGGNEGAWTLSSLTGKLGAIDVKKLSEDEDASGYVGTWTISIDNEGAATIAPNVEGYGRILCNTNSGMERFTTYESDVQSNMLLPGIYKKYGTPAETKKDQSISFNPTSYTATIGKENTYPTLTAQSSGAKTWTSSNTEVATINESTGEITLVAAGKTTISVSVAGDDTYKEGKGSYELTVENAPIVSGETWNLVTDASTLAEGDVIVIVAANADVAMSTTQNSNNRGQQAITKNTNNNTVTINDKVQQLTLGAGKTTGTFSLSTGSGFLYAVSSSDNYLRTQTNLNDNGSWTITIASNVATLKANGKNTRNWLRYNSSNKIFSCYASGQGDVQIYRMNDTRASQSISYSAETGSIDKYTSVKDIPTLDLSGVKTSVSYTSSNEAVATVSETGEITPVKAGTTTITAIAAESTDYREAKASFVLTVTDSSPYLSATASKTSVAAAGETVTITVDTNVDSWSATSDNDAFVVRTPSGNTIDITIAENTGEERTANITVTAGTLSETITLTQKAASSGTKVDKTATITFGTKNVNISSEKVTANDDCNNSWTITTEGTTSFTAQPTYYQVGSSSKPATSITFTTTLPSDAEVGSIEAKFGGFSGTAGSVSLKVGDTSVGSGSLNATNDVTVSSNKTAAGNVVTVSITGIAKGVKCYYIKVGYKTAE